jgi:hypothetical protein
MPRTASRRIIERVVVSLWRDGVSVRDIDRNLRTMRAHISDDDIRRIILRWIDARSENKSLGRREVAAVPATTRDRIEGLLAGLALLGAVIAAALNEWIVSLYTEED